MKVLIASNAPWASTGYGTQTRQLAERLRDHGHEVGIFAFYGLAGSRLDWNGIRVYPGYSDPYGNDVLAQHAQTHFGGDVRGGLVITLIDAWVLNPGVIGQLNCLSWTPVDHEPCPPRVVQALKGGGQVPVAMTRFGERMLKDAGLSPVYAPHGIDTRTFRPLEDRDACKAKHGIAPDRFVVGMVAANKGKPPRKGFPEAIEAFARFQREHPNALLYLHTEATGVHDGVNLPNLLAHHKVPTDAVKFVDQYQHCVIGLSDPEMCEVFNSLDVLLSPSYGEGFGIPIVEAQACGTPVVVTDCTAMSELGEAGWKVSGQAQWTAQEAFWTTPSVDELTWALGEAHKTAARLRTHAREFAERYDADRVFAEHWLPIIEAHEPRERTPSVQVAA